MDAYYLWGLGQGAMDNWELVFFNTLDAGK